MGDSGGKPHVGTGAVRHSTAFVRQDVNFLPVDVHGMRKPDILTHPA
jgi:hypothetical protein